MEAETPFSVFRRATQDADNMLLPTSAAMSVMLAALDMSVAVAAIDNVYLEFGLHKDTMLDLPMFESVVQRLTQLAGVDEQSSQSAQVDSRTESFDDEAYCQGVLQTPAHPAKPGAFAHLYPAEKHSMQLVRDDLLQADARARIQTERQAEAAGLQKALEGNAGKQVACFEPEISVACLPVEQQVLAEQAISEVQPVHIEMIAAEVNKRFQEFCSAIPHDIVAASGPSLRYTWLEQHYLKIIQHVLSITNRKLPCAPQSEDKGFQHEIEISALPAEQHARAKEVFDKAPVFQRLIPNSKCLLAC